MLRLKSRFKVVSRLRAMGAVEKDLLSRGTRKCKIWPSSTNRYEGIFRVLDGVTPASCVTVVLCECLKTFDEVFSTPKAYCGRMELNKALTSYRLYFFETSARGKSRKAKRTYMGNDFPAVVIRWRHSQYNWLSPSMPNLCRPPFCCLLWCRRSSGMRFGCSSAGCCCWRTRRAARRIREIVSCRRCASLCDSFWSI